MMSIEPYIGIGLFIAFCIIIVVQLFYYLFFFRRLAFYKAPATEQYQEYPVSVVICARDEADNLTTHLPGVLLQAYRTTHEVIVVNDNSVDESKYLLEEFRKTFKHLHPVELTQEAKMIPGKKFPLSMGIKSAKYEVVLLTDADCMPASEFWIQHMQAAYKPGIDIVLGYGSYKKKPGLLNKIIRFETFHTALQYLSYALAGKTYMGVGRNLSYRKSLFFNNKGFSSINQIPGGDDDLFINMVAKPNNTAVVLHPEAFTVSEPKRTWTEWMRQKTRHYSASRYYKTSHKLLLAGYSISHALVYPLLIASAIMYCWWMALAAFTVRLLLQAIIWYKAMKKLQETDLWPAFILWDIWMFLYYFIFSAALWKKPKNNWN